MEPAPHFNNIRTFFVGWVMEFLTLGYKIHFMIILKFGYSEKAMKIEKIFHLKFDATQ